MLTDGHYGVITTIDGKTITDGNVYDNYRYHYDGDVTLSMPNKPDFEPPVNPPVTPGTGTVTPLPEQPTNSSSNTPENTTGLRRSGMATAAATVRRTSAW